MIERRRYMGGEALPYDAEVEYLESTGTQYIDTLFVPKVTPRIHCIMSFNATADRDFFGFAVNRQPSWIGNIYHNANNMLSSYYRYDTTASINVFSSTSPSIYIDQFNVYDIGAVVDVDNVRYWETTPKSFSANTQTVYIFKGRTYASIRMAACQLYDGDVLVLDLIPVRVGQVGYMYDKVSKQLFGNSGTGSFVIGPDK